MEAVFGPGYFFHSRRGPVFVLKFVYNTIRTTEFTLSEIFFSGK